MKAGAMKIRMTVTMFATLPVLAGVSPARATRPRMGFGRLAGGSCGAGSATNYSLPVSFQASSSSDDPSTSS
jgi:hypothetical protein